MSENEPIEGEIADSPASEDATQAPESPQAPPAPYVPRQVAVPDDTSPAGLLATAVARGASVDELDRLLALKERFDQEEARKAFTAAMAKFKADAPVLFKDKHVSFETDKGTTSYSHATLGAVTLVIAESLGRYGLSHRWEINQDDPSRIVCTCILTHELGHSEQTTLVAGADTSGGKNPIQAIASSVTYLQRYTLLGATGMAAMEGDDDAQAGGQEYITEEQQAELHAIIEQLGDSFMARSFFRGMGMGKIAEEEWSLALIPARRFKQAKKVLEAKRNARN